MSNAKGELLRLLVVCPSWLGDTVMATPALRLIRRSFPGIFVGGLMRPGLDELLAGGGFFDEVHIARASGVMGPKHAAAKLRPRRYDAALLLTNSFSTALTTRLAGIPRRIGYDRDLRGILLTDKLRAPTRPDGSWAPTPAVDYYLRLVRECLVGDRVAPAVDDEFLELGVTPEQESAGLAVLAKAGIAEKERFAILNPGGNNEAKRWPADRFARLAAFLHRTHSLRVVVNGSPGERDLTEQIAATSGLGPACVSLATLGITIGSLKSVVRRASLMVTNDTGPRHLAAALGVPLVTMFGPTDHRWTTIRTRPAGPEKILLADPTLPEAELANDHPDRCRIDRITEQTVEAAVNEVLVPRPQ